jgi:hypothetical protein
MLPKIGEALINAFTEFVALMMGEELAALPLLSVRKDKHFLFLSAG